jgi:REP element-mobilizing transposase RayT
MKLHRQHNVTELKYHLVSVVKYRKDLIDNAVKDAIIEACKHIQTTKGRMWFIEIGAQEDHVHYLLQAEPTLSPTQIATRIKGITGRNVFFRCPYLRKELYNHEFWTDGYYISTVSCIEGDITRWYVRNQEIE